MASSEKLEINQCRTCYSTTKGLKLLTDLTKCSGNQHISYAELLTDVCNINVSIPQKNQLYKYAGNSIYFLIKIPLAY